VGKPRGIAGREGDAIPRYVSGTDSRERNALLLFMDPSGGIHGKRAVKLTGKGTL
jgi:hypothetical protein